MHLKSLWSYVNKGLLIILSILIISALAAIIYLTHTLLGLKTLVTTGGNSAGTVIVLQDVLINLDDMQASVRGYIISGDTVFLKPYEAATKRLPADISILQNSQSVSLTNDQRQRLVDLIEQKTDISKRAVELYDSQGFEAAQAGVRRGAGEDAMFQIRNEISDISSNDLRQVGPLLRNSVANVHRALWVASMLAVLILCTSGAIAWYFKRTILQERALESTKNEFLSLASHQLRTPATNVKQYIGLLLDGYMGDLNEQQRHALTVAYKNNESEINIMNDLLDVAKLDLNRIQLHKKMCNVVRIANHTVKDYTTVAKDAGQTIKLVAPKQIMANVDESYIKGVIDNLVDNAVKYSKANSRITVTVDREQDHVKFTVKDQGLGIRKRDFSKLFNKFSRLDNEFSANSQGSGLGLYWVKKVVSLHGGSVDVTSREGKGSEFIVLLPVR